MNNLFEGQRIRLRSLEAGDAETIFKFSQDNEISRRDARVFWPNSLERIRQRLEKANTSQTGDDKDLAIETLDGQMVGEINTQLCDARNGTFSLGIGLGDRTAWGKGYAKEAILLVLRHMFHERRYQKCNIGVYAFNQRAVDFYRHLGFQDEGRIRRSYFTNGTYYDEILLGMTLEEFNAHYSDWEVTLEEDLRQTNQS
jgi:RimJ/RimL family protein N-acetyltransferase